MDYDLLMLALMCLNAGQDKYSQPVFGPDVAREFATWVQVKGLGKGVLSKGCKGAKQKPGAAVGSSGWDLRTRYLSYT